MGSVSKSEVKSLLKKYNLRPSKGLGQNFLIDKTAIRKIIAAADLKPEDIVLEIGPGIGNLTIELAKKAGEVIGVEKDPNLVRVLNNELRIKNIKIIQDDILKILNSTTAHFQWAGLPSPYSRATAKFPIHNSYKVIGNLPFYLTAPVIRKFLEYPGTQCQEMTLVIQKEVAQRICSRPPDMSLLAVSIQFYAQPKIISYISKKSFWPQPEVDAAIIKLKKKSEKRKIDTDLFFKIVKAGFSQPRKQLINNLSKKLKIDKIKTEAWLLKNNIQPTKRAETLDVEEWIKLTKTF